MAQKAYSSHLQLLSDKRWQALAGIDVDILAERLQREGAGRFSADWATLLPG